MSHHLAFFHPQKGISKGNAILPKSYKPCQINWLWPTVQRNISFGKGNGPVKADWNKKLSGKTGLELGHAFVGILYLFSSA